jgi:protein phosphatase
LPSEAKGSPTRRQLETTALTDVGRVRESNEDSYGIASDLGLVIVADGMGGHAGGEVASAIVVESVEREVRAIGAFAKAAPSLALTAAIRAANDAVREQGNARPSLRGMGSTVVAILFVESIAHVAHAGDSRAYRIRNGEVERLTRDHSLVEEYLAENPDASEDDLEGSYRHLVTRAVGAAPSLEVDVAEIECHPDDVILVCTDGLTGPVDDLTIGELVTGAKTLEEAAKALVDAAIEAGGPDNVTVALARLR